MSGDGGGGWPMVSGTTDLTVSQSSSTENVYSSSSVSGMGDSVYKVFPCGATPVIDKGLGDGCLPSAFACASGTLSGVVGEVGERDGAHSKRRFDECGAVERVQGAKKIKATPMQVQEISGQSVVRGLWPDVPPPTDAFSSVGFMSSCEAHPIRGAILHSSGDQASKSPGPIGGWQGPMDLNFLTGTAMPVLRNRHGETSVLCDAGDSTAIDSGSSGARHLGLVGARKRGFEGGNSGGSCIEPTHKRQALASISEKPFESMSVPQPAPLVTRPFGSGSCPVTDHFGSASFCGAPMSSSTSTVSHRESVMHDSQTAVIIGSDAEQPLCHINREEVAGVAHVFGHQNQLSVSRSGRVTRLSEDSARVMLHDDPVTMPSFGAHFGEPSARPESVRNEDVRGLGVGGSADCSFSSQRPAMNAGRVMETDGSCNAPRSNHPRGPRRFRMRGSPSVNTGTNNSSVEQGPRPMGDERTETPVTNIQDGAATSRFSTDPTSRSNAAGQRNHHRLGPPSEYRRFGQCCCVCRFCHARFWFEERLSTSTRRTGPLYSHCCRGGTVQLNSPRMYSPYIQQLYSDSHFMNNIRAYNQMFSMTSLGATVDDSINQGRGPYVFKVSGQIYHTIGRLCPEPGKDPRFLQLYIYDTDREVDYRLGHFTTRGQTNLRRDIVEGLVRELDEHNALVQLFRTARDKLREADVPEFHVRLYGVVGSAQHELPTANDIGAIVFEDGPETESEFDIVIQTHSGEPERVNKLHPCYMAFQLPLMFVYGEQGYHTDLRLVDVAGVEADTDKRITMNAYYAYQIHDRDGMYGLITRGGRLFQQYVVMAYCCMEQNRMDFVRKKQSDIRGEYLVLGII